MIRRLLLSLALVALAFIGAGAMQDVSEGYAREEAATRALAAENPE